MRQLFFMLLNLYLFLKSTLEYMFIDFEREREREREREMNVREKH